MSNAAHQLAYGRKRRRIRWLWVELAIVVTVATVLSLNTERLRIWRAQAAFLYWQRHLKRS